MATELAQAYVQIIPSAQGIGGKLKQALGGGDVSGAGNAAGAKIGSGLVKAMTRVIAAAGIGKVISDAISEGADYEQNIGGMETLYKQNSDDMVKYANEAFKTAQISANDYMQAATQFSASLLSSLGGDTKKASESANQAIIDMADNSNKMGTSMQSIQDAYRGFAKQNYTMLDNLSLGYGGTKTEMERLLADAQKISGVKYDISNLNDVYSAIHVIQTEMGITGTSAKEGATTIAGSINMLKASWSNLQAQLVNGGDVGQAMSDLGESLMAAFSNLMPAIGRIISGIPTMLSSMVQQIVSNVPQMVTAAQEMIQNLAAGFQTALPQLLASGQQLVQFIVDGVSQATPQIVAGAQSLLDNFTQFISGGGLADLLQGGIQMVQGVIQGITQNLPQILQTAVQMISQLVSGLASRAAQLISAGLQLLGVLIQGILQNLPALITAAGQIIISLVQAIIVNLPQIIDAGMQMIQSIVQGLEQNGPAILEAIAQVIAQLCATIVEHLPEIIEKGIEILAKLAEGIIKAIPKVIEAVPQIFNEFKGAFGQYDWGEMGRNIIDGIKNGISSTASSIADAAKQAAQNALDAAKSLLGIHSPSTVMRDEVGAMIAEGWANGISENQGKVGTAVETVAAGTTELAKAAINQANAEYASVMALPQYATDQIVGSYVYAANAAAGGFTTTITQQTESMVAAAQLAAQQTGDTIKNTLNNTNSDQSTLATGEEAVTNLQTGIQSTAPQVQIATGEFAGSILQLFKQRLDPIAFQQIGYQIAAGIAQGIQQGTSVVTQVIDALIQTAVETAKTKAAIGSPSKLFAKEVGQWIPAGIALGITQNQDSIGNAVAEATGRSTAYLSALEPAYAASGEMSGRSSGFTQNITINSPKALTPSEVARQARNSTRQMVLALKGYA